MRKIFYLLLVCISPLIPSLQAQNLAQDFTVTTSTNQTISLYEDLLNQDKTVVIELFFVACPPCRAIAPQVEDLYQKWGAGTGDVEFIALSTSTRDLNASINNYKAGLGLTFPGVGQDGGGWDAANLYKSGYGLFLGTPTFLVVAPNGEVVYFSSIGNPDDVIEGINTAITNTGATLPYAIPPTALSITAANEAPLQDITLTVVQTDTRQDLSTVVDSTGSYVISISDEAILNDSLAYLEASTSHTDATQGVSTLDIVLVTKHILNIEPLPDTYAFFAADVNNSNTITTFDVVTLRRLILGIDSTFQTKPIWTFFNKTIDLSQYDNPLAIEDKAYLYQLPLTSIRAENAGFVAVKTGDVNHNALQLDGRTTGKAMRLTIENQRLQAGKTYRIPIQVSANTDLQGLQFALKAADGVTIKAINSPTLSNWSDSHYYTLPNTGISRISWSDVNLQQLDAERSLLELEVETLVDGDLTELIQLSNSWKVEAIYKDLKIGNVLLNFTNKKPLPLSLYPNPTAQQTIVEYTIPQAGQVILDLYDTNGRLVNSDLIQHTNKGTYQYELNVRREGTYYLVVSQNNQPIGQHILYKK